MRHLSIIILAAIGLSGCATSYQDVEESSNSASVVFMKGSNQGYGISKSSRSGFDIYDEQACSKPQRAVAFELTSASEKTRLVASSKPLLFVGGVVNYSPGVKTGDLTLQGCAKAGKFNPKRGVTYKVQLNGTGQRCDLSVVESDTGSTPEGFETWTPLKEGSACR